MHRPSIALACILKNEIENIDRLLASVEGCFDIIHLTDTGSTDGSKELIEKYQDLPPEENPAKTPIRVHYFDWIDDFSAARNYSFSHAETDYIAWADLDDSLSDKNAFIDWRNNTMKYADFWIATYHYAFDGNGKAMCSFARERVVKASLKLPWNYFVHEGIVPISPLGLPVKSEYAQTWAINHMRTPQDLEKDRSRNIRLLADRKKDLDPRMLYYYGKELFEANKPMEAFGVLLEATSEEKLELHDRVMGLQYACLSAMLLNQFDRAIQLAHQGLQLNPQRAEFYNIIGDCYTKLNRHADAIPFYTSAPQCQIQGGGIQQAIFQAEESYKHYPYNKLAQIYFLLGNAEKAEACIDEALKFGPHAESEGIKSELVKVKKVVRQPKKGEVQDTGDIVISCHPQGFYEWDEDVYKSRGIGGSETAVVEMAQHLSHISKRKVIVFNNRTSEKVFGNVHYKPAAEVADYFANNMPYVHIAWRHNIKMTTAPTFVWNHDLGFQGLQAMDHYTKIFCLSEFHRNFVKNLLNVPYEKIHVTSNGINPDRFKGLDFTKEPGKVVFSSSPDRGIKEAIEVMDRVVKKLPFATLHVFYGLHNMYKVGRNKEADELKALMDSRSYLKFHDNVPQSQLTLELASSQVWLYPTNFLETFCITALEMLSCKVYPVARAEWGAVQETIESCQGQKSAMVYDENYDTYAEKVIEGIEKNLGLEITFNPNDKSWEKVAHSWIDYFNAILI